MEKGGIVHGFVDVEVSLKPPEIPKPERDPFSLPPASGEVLSGREAEKRTRELSRRISRVETVILRNGRLGSAAYDQQGNKVFVTEMHQVGPIYTEYYEPGGKLLFTVRKECK